MPNNPTRTPRRTSSVSLRAQRGRRPLLRSTMLAPKAEKRISATRRASVSADQSKSWLPMANPL